MTAIKITAFKKYSARIQRDMLSKVLLKNLLRIAFDWKSRADSTETISYSFCC